MRAGLSEVPTRLISASESGQTLSEREEIMAVGPFNDCIPLVLHASGVPRSEDRTCYRRNGIAVTTNICGEKNGRLGGPHDRPECEGQRHNRQWALGEISRCDFRRSELNPLVQVTVDGANSLCESGGD